MPPSTARLYFLDWARILAFFLLIVYHTGMYYVSWDWHVKSPHASKAIEPLMMLSSPWRLGLLFLIGGVASRYLIDRLGGAAFVRARSSRLLIPLLFGMLVIVPPQAYLEVVEKVAYQGSYADFMRLYLQAYHGFCRGSDCLILPTWNHLWFLPYLWAYGMLLAGTRRLLGARLDALAARACALLRGWRLLVLPTLYLGSMRVVLADHFPTTHALVDDWFSHAHDGFLFLLGALLARRPAFWQGMETLRWPALGMALCSWAALVIFYSLPDTLRWPEARMPMRMVLDLCGWCAIVAACGFARRHLNHDSERRRYLSDAVFPVYILHQTLIVTIAHLIKPAGIAAPVEALILMILTGCISFGAYALVRRVALLRPLFGLSAAPAGPTGTLPSAPATPIEPIA